MTVATFKPLKRNRFRCNQTDEIVGRAGVARIRRQLEGRDRRKELGALTPVRGPEILSAKVRSNLFDGSYVFCPWSGCGAKNYVRREDNRVSCFVCEKRIALVRDLI